MSGCAAFPSGGPAGIADALAKVDCLASDATSMSFAHLFGDNGAFRVALTMILTLYVALMAVNLLTGRSTLRLSTLTPRMMTMGLVLTFVTSWIAYQSVVWNLAVGAPDEVAGVIVGTKGSATAMFAERLDVFFNAISEAASAKPPASAAIAAVPSTALMSPGSVLSLAAIILLLGTVGVLVACRLALAALLILGPIFIVLALFGGTRGLFEGWLKSVATFAFVPLLTVLLGSGALLALDPMIADLGSGGEITLRAAVTILVVAIIYLTLMFLAFKTAGNLASSWRIGKAERETAPAILAANVERRATVTSPTQTSALTNQLASDRVRTAIMGLGSMTISDRSSTSRIESSVTTRSISDRAAATPPTVGVRRGSFIGHRLNSSLTNPRQGFVK
jgi:type IV secretion system protein VirB6